MNLFISPHLDDIALSCGGRAHALARSGETVLIATICTGDTPVSVADSLAVLRVHDEWRLGSHPYARRRAEDRRACLLLGARAIHLGLLDAVYRQDGAGRMLYSRKFIGARVKPYDRSHHAAGLRSALEKLDHRFPGARVYCPLGLGAHVDHVIARQQVARVFAAGQIVYYEDYPYADLAGANAWPAITSGLRPTTFSLSRAGLRARIGAIAEYRSQLFALFEERDPVRARARMAVRVGRYVRLVNGERFWNP